MEAIQNRKFSNPMILKVIIRIDHCISGRSEILLPSHVGLAGNSADDAAVTAAPRLTATNSPVSYADCYPLVDRSVLSKWQTFWDAEVSNSLHAWHEARYSLALLRHKHTHATHSYHVKGDAHRAARLWHGASRSWLRNSLSGSPEALLCLCFKKLLIKLPLERLSIL